MKKEVLISNYLFFQEGPGVRNYQYRNDGIKLLNVSNLVDGKIILDNSKRYISKEEGNGKYSHFLCDTGDLIIASSGIKVEYFAKKMGFVESTMLPLCMNTSTIRFKSLDNSKLNIRYFMYYLKSAHFKKQLSSNITGSAQLNFGPSHLKKMKFLYVPIKEQNDISLILYKIDELINIKKSQLKELDMFINSIFDDMFGDPIVNNMNWPVIKLKNLTTLITNGNTPKGGEQVYVNNGIEFYRSQNVWKNRIERADIAYIDLNTHNKMKKSSLKHNDLLITKTGRINTENSSLGRTAIYEGEDDKGNINGHVYLVRVNKSENVKFILRILISDEYRKYIRSVCVGGIDKRQLNKEHIEEFPIIYPSLELQNRFTQIVEQIDKQKKEFEDGLKKLEEMQAALMQEYFG